MALATTCPQCKTSFKVVPDQLKLRRGLVRCGACQHVFSGIDFLRYVDESHRAEPAPGSAAAQPAGDDLKTAFFLPETILAAPSAADLAGRHPPGEAPTPDDGAPGERLPDEVAEAAPIVGTTDLDLLAFEASPLPEPAEPRVEPVAPAEARWPGIEIDWGVDAPVADAGAPGAGPPEVGTAREVGAARDAESAFEAEAALPGEAVPGPEASVQAESAPAAAAGTRPAHDASRARANADADEIVAWGPGSTADLAIGDGRDEIESLTATTPGSFADVEVHDEQPATAASGLRSTPAVASPMAASPGPSIEPALRDAGGQRVAASGRGAAHDEDETAIDYFSSGRRGVGFIDRHGPIALVGAMLLALLLGLQWALAQRSMIAARLPALAPMMSAALAPFGLRVGLPRDLESLTIESFELQASASPGVLAMSALLRNRADYGVQWPSMQLTLTDSANRVLVRKVLGPDDYLRESRGGEGLPPRAEWPVRLALEANDLQPAGYSVILFYP